MWCDEMCLLLFFFYYYFIFFLSVSFFFCLFFCLFCLLLCFDCTFYVIQKRALFDWRLESAWKFGVLGVNIGYAAAAAAVTVCTCYFSSCNRCSFVRSLIY